MKNKILLVLLTTIFVFLGQINAQSKTELNAVVDERVELLSIIARLAGYEEYSYNNFSYYTNKVDTYFEKFKEHELILFMKQIRQSNRIAFDAVMSMAVHLKLNPLPEAITSFTDQIPDKRWTRQKALTFLTLLRKFYTDTRFHQFFSEQKSLYTICEKRMQVILSSINLDWFTKFYGTKTNGNFKIIPGLLNGPGNYGPKVVADNKETMYSIIATWKMDSTGLPDYASIRDEIVPNIIHEFNHSFINHLIYAREAALKESMDTIFSYVKAKMNRIGYGKPVSMIFESLVRVAVTRYLMDQNTDPLAYNSDIITNRNEGFLWFPELFAVMGTYVQNRIQYPDFKSFLPVIIAYYRDLKNRIQFIHTDFENKSPKVIRIEPFENGSLQVDPKLKEIKLYFSKPLNTKTGISFNYGDGGKDHYPLTKNITLSPDGNFIVMPVVLKANYDYSFIITGLAFKSIDDYPLINYKVNFKTASE